MRKIETYKVETKFGNWGACLELRPGHCLYSSGQTEEEVVKNIKEAANHPSIVRKYGKVL